MHTLVVVLAKVTVVPAESVAVIVKVPAPPGTQFSLEGDVRTNVWFVAPMLILVGVPLVSAHVPPAGALGVMVQVPIATAVTKVPETVHTVGVELAKVTVVFAESLAVPSENVPSK